MKIVIPSVNGKLCSHFGHCENFTFVKVESGEIKNIEIKIPENGISCQSAGWIAEQGADMVLAGGMGLRPLTIFEQNGIKVVTGCPEIEVKTLVLEYISGSLVLGENSCGGEHHNCHSNEKDHCCH